MLQLSFSCVSRSYLSTEILDRADLQNISLQVMMIHMCLQANVVAVQLFAGLAVQYLITNKLKVMLLSLTCV